MFLYLYDNVTYRYTGFQEAQTDPLDEKVVMLPNSVTLAPPTMLMDSDQNTLCPVWNKIKKQWDTIIDYRGDWYYASGKKYTISTIYDNSEDTISNSTLAKRTAWNCENGVITTLNGDVIYCVSPQMIHHEFSEAYINLIEWQNKLDGWKLKNDVSDYLEAICEKIQAIKLEYTSADYQYGDYLFQADSDSLQIMNNYLSEIDNKANTYDWILSDNSTITITYADLQDLYSQIVTRNQIITNAVQEYRASLLACTTYDEINSILPDSLEVIFSSTRDFTELREIIETALKTESLELVQEIKLNRINQDYEVVIRQILNEYVPESEMMTWETQYAEAKAYLESGDANDAPCLNIIAQVRGCDLDTLAQKAYQKGLTYKQVSATIIGYRQRLQDEIESATTIEALNQIVFDYEYITSLLSAGASE